MGFGEFDQEESADHCWNGKLSWFKVGGIANIAFFITAARVFLTAENSESLYPYYIPVSPRLDEVWSKPV